MSISPKGFVGSSFRRFYLFFFFFFFFLAQLPAWHQLPLDALVQLQIALVSGPLPDSLLVLNARDWSQLQVASPSGARLLVLVFLFFCRHLFLFMSPLIHLLRFVHPGVTALRP